MYWATWNTYRAWYSAHIGPGIQHMEKPAPNYAYTQCGGIYRHEFVFVLMRLQLVNGSPFVAFKDTAVFSYMSYMSYMSYGEGSRLLTQETVIEDKSTSSVIAGLI